MGYNARILYWLHHSGRDIEDIKRKVDEDTTLIEDENGHRIPWTIVYGTWIMRMWAAWAESLGYKKGNYRAAMADGHSPKSFDAWLQQECKVKITIEGWTDVGTPKNLYPLFSKELL